MLHPIRITRHAAPVVASATWTSALDSLQLYFGLRYDCTCVYSLCSKVYTVPIVHLHSIKHALLDWAGMEGFCFACLQQPMRVSGFL